jgi:hypothetical protein
MQQKDFYLDQICSLFVHDSQKHQPISTFISFHTTKSLIQHLITIIVVPIMKNHISNLMSIATHYHICFKWILQKIMMRKHL